MEGLLDVIALAVLVYFFGVGVGLTWWASRVGETRRAGWRLLVRLPFAGRVLAVAGVFGGAAMLESWAWEELATTGGLTPQHAVAVLGAYSMVPLCWLLDAITLIACVMRTVRNRKHSDRPEGH